MHGTEELAKALARIPVNRRWQLRHGMSVLKGGVYTCQIFGTRDARLVDGAGVSRDPAEAVTKAVESMGRSQ